MTTLIAQLAESAGIPVRRLAAGSLTASDWISVMATCHRLAARLDAAEQDELDTLLERLEARMPMEVQP